MFILFHSFKGLELKMLNQFKILNENWLYYSEIRKVKIICKLNFIKIIN